MCLSKVIFTTNNRVGIGYKVIDRDYVKKTKNSFNIFDNNRQWSKKWTEAFNSDDTSLGYPLGFHIWLTKKSAKEYALPGDVIVKVEYKDILAFGFNFAITKHYQCIIANKMRIVEIID